MKKTKNEISIDPHRYKKIKKNSKILFWISSVFSIAIGFFIMIMVLGLENCMKMNDSTKFVFYLSGMISMILSIFSVFEHEAAFEGQSRKVFLTDEDVLRCVRKQKIFFVLESVLMIVMLMMVFMNL